MANTRIIPDPKDAPPVTATSLREIISRIYELESITGSTQSGINGTGLNAQVQNLSNQVAAINSRKSYAAVGATRNTGTLPNDNTFHTYGSNVQLVFSVPPEAKVILTGGCGQVTVAGTVAGSGIIGETAYYLFTYPDLQYVPIDGFNISRFYSSSTNTTVGGPTVVSAVAELPAGNYIVSLRTNAWTTGTTTGSVNFIDPYITVAVTSR